MSTQVCVRHILHIFAGASPQAAASTEEEKFSEEAKLAKKYLLWVLKEDADYVLAFMQIMC